MTMQSPVRAVGFILVLLLGISPAWADDWLVTKLTGQAWIAMPDTPAIKAAAGTIVPDRATFSTERNARARLERGAESIAVGPNTVLSPRESSFWGTTTILQQSGRIELEVEKRNVQHFSVETPLMAAVVKGTRFVVTVSARAVDVKVSRGLVEVKDLLSGEVANIAPGQSAAVSSAGRGLQVGGVGRMPDIQQGQPRSPQVGYPGGAAQPNAAAGGSGGGTGAGVAGASNGGGVNGGFGSGVASNSGIGGGVSGGASGGPAGIGSGTTGSGSNGGAGGGPRGGSGGISGGLNGSISGGSGGVGVGVGGGVSGSSGGISGGVSGSINSGSGGISAGVSGGVNGGIGGNSGGLSGGVSGGVSAGSGGISAGVNGGLGGLGGGISAGLGGGGISAGVSGGLGGALGGALGGLGDALGGSGNFGSGSEGSQR
jgi:hypothetical protein